MERPKTTHYQFFCNRECEYFPCHKNADPDNFNCLFCYCPLYALGKNAVGSFATFQMEIKTAQIVLFRTNEKIIRQLHHDIRKLPN
mgnify:CR=1 FL=1